MILLSSPGPSAARVALAALLCLSAACDEAAPSAAPNPAEDEGDAALAGDASVGADAGAPPDDSGDDAGLEADAGSEPDAGGSLSPIDAVAPATPQSLAVRSAEAYADNESGLVASSRLLAWLADWEANRPSGVEGDLVIAQLGPAAGPLPFVASQLEGPRRVRVYDASDLVGLTELRSNGLTAVGSVPAHGTRVDTWLRKYNVRPNHDLLLFAAGASSAETLDSLARAFLTLRYWGVEHAFLGLVNGSVEARVPEASRSAQAATPPESGAVRVSDLLNRNFVLLADVGAVRAALGKETLIDVRSAAEYAGSALSTSPVDKTCRLSSPHCTPSFSGRIKGAVHLDWQNLFDSTDYSLRPLAELDVALAPLGIAANQTAIVYDGDHGFSAATAFALLAVVGVPTRWYAASFLEWGALNATHPTSGLRLLAADSPWRTDLFGTLTEGSTLWATVDTCTMPLLLDATPSSTERVQQLDLTYKRTPPALPPVGGGENACN